MNKKTFILSVLCALAPCASQALAQSVDSIPHYYMGQVYIQPSTFMEMSDGFLLGGFLLMDRSSPTPVHMGYDLQKVSRPKLSGDSNMRIADTLFLHYDRFPWHCTAKDPRDGSNILAEFASDMDEDLTYLRIRRFDNDLNFDTTDITVPLGDYSVCTSGEPGVLLDPCLDLVVLYYKWSFEDHPQNHIFNFARIGTDGTVKHTSSVSEMSIDDGVISGPIVLSESPLKYCCWGTYLANAHEYYNVYVLDSLFEVERSASLPLQASNYVSYSYDTYYSSFLGLDDDQMLVARSYDQGPHSESGGVEIQKYDREFNLLKGLRLPEEFPMEFSHHRAKPINLKKDDEGYIYFAYITSDTYYSSPRGRISVVKIDADLNIIWQRYCLEPIGHRREWTQMILLEDNAVAVVGINDFAGSEPSVFYVVVNDDYDGMEEEGIIMRPYTYWPNPAQDELNLQFSPDVEPKLVERWNSTTCKDAW